MLYLLVNYLIEFCIGMNYNMLYHLVFNEYFGPQPSSYLNVALLND